MAKTHWKMKMDKDWIGVYVLPEGKPILVTLLGVKWEKVKVKGKMEEHYVARFAPNPYFDKPMLLSANVHFDRLEEWTGSEYYEDYENLNIKVILQREMDKSFGGGKDWALRMVLPPELKYKSETYVKILNWLKEDAKRTVSAATSKFSVSPELLKILEDERKS